MVLQICPLPVGKLTVGVSVEYLNYMLKETIFMLA